MATSKVLMVVTSPISPSPRLEKEALALSKAGFSIMVVGLDQESKFQEVELRSFGQIYRLRVNKLGSAKFKVKHLKGFINIARWNLALLRFLVTNRKEIILIHSFNFDTIIPALIFKLIFKKSVIYDISDFYSDMFKSEFKILRKIISLLDLFLIHFADTVILADESRVEQIKGSKPKKLVFIYNSIPEELLENLQIKDKKRGTLTIGYVGLLQFERGLIPMISVVKKHENWKLILAGYGAEEDKIKEMSNRIGNIEFLGRVSYEEALKIYSNCDVLFATYDPLIPNHRYSSANKLFEAMALGKPIIVAHNTGMDKIVEKHNLGFIVDYGDELQLENSLKEIEIWDDTKAKEFGGKVKTVYRENFSWKIMEERLVRLHEELVQN